MKPSVQPLHGRPERSRALKRPLIQLLAGFSLLELSAWASDAHELSHKIGTSGSGFP